MAYKKLKLWFDKDLAILLSEKIEEINASFDRTAFVEAVDHGVDSLELKGRVEWIADQIRVVMGEDDVANIQQLIRILGPENEKETGMFTEFYWVMPIAKYVEKYGIEHFDLSMEAIREITKRNTGEFTIRPFIERYPEQTMSVLLGWSKDSNRHVRRLASEGPRPRLPWAPKLQRFIDDPRPLFPILEQLKDDPSKYVQKSVANCINDIIKDQEGVAQSLLESWLPASTPARSWIIRHALRNLRKQKKEWALEILCQL